MPCKSAEKRKNFKKVYRKLKKASIRSNHIDLKKLSDVVIPRKKSSCKRKTTTRRNLTSATSKRKEFIERSHKVNKKRFQQKIRINAVKRSKGACVRYSLSNHAIQQRNTSQKRKRLIINKENTRKCPACCIMFLNTLWCKKHIKQKHSKRVNILHPEPIGQLNADFVIYCKQCGRLFQGQMAKYKLTSHQLTVHTVVKPHHCLLCGKGFSYNYLCVKHMKNCKENKPKIMTSNVSKSQNSCERKPKVQAPHYWPVLVQDTPENKQFVKRNKLKNKQENELFVKRAKLNRKPSVEVSSKLVDTGSDLVSSLAQTVLSRPAKMPCKLNNEITQETFSCPKCDKVFSGVSSIKHLNFRIHYFKHLSLYPYTCPVCSHGFMQYFILCRHFRAMHRDYPALPIRANPQVTLCVKCFQVFTGADAMIELFNHVRTRQCLKSHVCFMCDQKFQCKANLISHTKIAHGIMLDGNQKFSEYELQNYYDEHQSSSSVKNSNIRLIKEVKTKVSSYGKFKTSSRTASRRFGSMSLFKKHQNTSDGVIENNLDTLVHLCSCCNQRFKMKLELNNHVRNCHVELTKNHTIGSSKNDDASSSIGEETNAGHGLQVERDKVLSLNQPDKAVSVIVKIEKDLDTEKEGNCHNSKIDQVLQMPSNPIWKPYEGDSPTTVNSNTRNIILSSSSINDKSTEQCTVDTGLHESDEEKFTLLTSEEGDTSEKSCKKCAKIFTGPNASTMLMKHKATHWTVKLGQFSKRSSERIEQSSNYLNQSHDVPMLVKSSQHKRRQNFNKCRTCSDCGLQFENLSLLLNHKKIIHHQSYQGTKSFGDIRHCDKCDKVFTGPFRSNYLSQHKRVHWSVTSNDVPNEPQSVTTASQLESNDSITIVQPKDQKCKESKSIENTRHCDKFNLFMCQDCGKGFSVKYHLKNHMEESHGKHIDCRVRRSNSCKQCCAVYVAKALLKRHMVVHECQDEVFTCAHCGWVFFTMSSLYRHRQKLHKKTILSRTNTTHIVRLGEKIENNLKAIEDSRVLLESNVAKKSEVDLRDDSEKYERHTQNLIAGQNLNENSDLLDAFQTLSRSNRKISTAHLSSCYEYEQMFDNNVQRAILESADEHQRTLSSKHDSLVMCKSNVMSMASKSPTSSPTCPDCGCSFSSRQSLKRHALLVHKKSLINTSKTAYSDQKIKRIVKNYTKIVKKIGRNDELIERHCTKCDTIIVGRNSYSKLWIHMQSHNLVKPYSCTECNKGFVLLSVFKIHMKNKHGTVMDFRSLRVNSCTQCTATFTGEAGKQLLRKHMSTHKNVVSDLAFSSRNYSNENISTVNTMETVQQFSNPNSCTERSEDINIGCIDLTSENESEHGCNTSNLMRVHAPINESSICESDHDKLCRIINTELSRRVPLNSEVIQTMNKNLNISGAFQTILGSNRKISTAHLDTCYDYEMCGDALQRDRMNTLNDNITSTSSKNDSLPNPVLNSISVATAVHVCPDCGRGFKSKQSFKRHALSIHQKNTHTLSKNTYSDLQLEQKCLLKNYKKNSLNKRISQREELIEKHCTKCDMVFVGRYAHQQLWSHMHSHSLVKPYTCPECKVGFVFPRNLKVHMLRLHGKVIDCRSLRISSCSQCDAKFTGQTGKLLLRKHMLTHKNICPFSCVYCGCKFVSDCSLRNHIKRLHNDQTKIFVNKELERRPCNINSPRQMQSSENNRTVNTDKSVQKVSESIIICNSDNEAENEEFGCIDLTSENEEDYVCNTNALNLSSVRVPNNELSNREFFQSDDRTKRDGPAIRLSASGMYECNRIDTSEQISLKAFNKFPIEKCSKIKSLLGSQPPKKNNLSAKCHTCLKCEMSFNHKDMLKTHVSSHHSKISSKTENDESAKTYSKCNTGFVGQDAAAMLSKHCVKHATESSVSDNTSNRFNCSECGFGCNLNIRLNIHLKNVHSDKHVISSEGEIMTSQCDQCQMVFKGPNSSSMMYKHKLTHNKIIHAKVKNPQSSRAKKYCCVMCDCTFTNPNGPYHLQRHMYYHLQVMPYYCYKCNKKFGLKSQLKYHMNRSHGIIIENNSVKALCALCEAVFINPNVLTEASMFWKHMLTHENVSVRNCSSCTNKRFSSHFNQSNRTKKSDGKSKKNSKRCTETYSNSDVMVRQKSLESSVKSSKHKRTYTAANVLKNNSIVSTTKQKQVKSCPIFSNEKEDMGTIDKLCETSNSNEGVNPSSTSSGINPSSTSSGINPSSTSSGMQLRHNLPSWIFSHYSCDICRVRFVSKFRLNKHNKLHHENHDESCAVSPTVHCLNKFTGASREKKEKQNGEKGDFGDNEVHPTFDNLSRVTLSKCEICRKSFSNRNLLIKHICTHGVHNCKVCDMKFPMKSHLKKHIWTHKNTHYMCNPCFVPFTSIVAFEAHIRLHKRVNFETKKDGFYVRKKTYAKMYLNNMRHMCKICKREFREKGTLQGHSRMHKNELHSHEVGIAVQEVSECLVCRRSFPNKSLLDAHLRIFAEQEVMSTTENLVVPNALFPVGDPQFMCAYCLLEFFTQEEAKDHFMHTSCRTKAEEDSN